ncbi:unnamed protein product [Prorocentrum cordatum]|uniref:tRNA/rRNA methyltransferase SpoU type domain-containing protein n=1 Tax=Prorocentrum cordatum TaxID=2364126 RepID=A0ABN9R9D2_9DINO|nr:unnamed protein product [Polarella glacialis]
MACFGAEGRLAVVHYGDNRDGDDDARRLGPDCPGFFDLPAISRQIARTACGAERSAGPIEPLPLGAFLERDRSCDVPLLVIETVNGATSLQDFEFPPCCRIVVGSEGRGVSSLLIQAMQARRGDAALYIPMPGPHPSLNAAMALSCALYEYRRQWPS